MHISQMHRKKKKKKKSADSCSRVAKAKRYLAKPFRNARSCSRSCSRSLWVHPGQAEAAKEQLEKNRLHTNTFFFFFCLSGSLSHTLFARCSCPLLSVPMLKEMSVPSGVTRLFLIRGGQGVLCLQPCKGAVTGPPRLQLADGDKCSKAKHQLHSLELWDCESSGSPSGRGCSAFSQARTCHPSCFFSYFAEHLQPQTVHAYILR